MLGHHLGAFVIEKRSMLDRCHTGPNRDLYAFGTVRMSCDTTFKFCRFIDYRFDLFIRQPSCADSIAFAEDPTRFAHLDYVRTILDHVSDGCAALLGTVGDT